MSLLSPHFMTEAECLQPSRRRERYDETLFVHSPHPQGVLHRPCQEEVCSSSPCLVERSEQDALLAHSPRLHLRHHD